MTSLPKKHKRVHSAFLRTIELLHEWNAAIQTGSQVFAALSNVATRLPVVTSACDATTSSAVVDAAVAASFPDLPQLLLDKHLTEAETQLANLRLIIEEMDVLILRISDVHDGISSVSLLQYGEPVEAVCVRSVQFPFSMSHMLEFIEDVHRLCVSDRHRRAMLVSATQYVDTASLAKTEAAWTHAGPFASVQGQEVFALARSERARRASSPHPNPRETPSSASPRTPRPSPPSACPSSSAKASSSKKSKKKKRKKKKQQQQQH